MPGCQAVLLECVLLLDCVPLLELVPGCRQSCSRAPVHGLHLDTSASPLRRRMPVHRHTLASSLRRRICPFPAADAAETTNAAAALRAAAAARMAAGRAMGADVGNPEDVEEEAYLDDTRYHVLLASSSGQRLRLVRGSSTLMSLMSF
jgi:hypothetical protein